MGVQIRLKRCGAIHRPFYHVVVTDKRNPRDGKFIEKIGYYDPSQEPSIVNIKADRMQHWYGLGAQLSDTASKLVKISKIDLKRNTAAK